MKQGLTYSIRTMGCKANTYDSQVLGDQLAKLGFTQAPKGAPVDLFVINSCTVTEEADRQCHREARAIRKKHPEAMTIVTGCYAEVAADKLRAHAEFDLVVENKSKTELTRQVAERFELPLPETEQATSFLWGQAPTGGDKTRSFVKIQEGCNDFCTYCVIPYARGQSRSVRPGMVIAEIQRLANEGVKEVVLTGTNIGDFGHDFDTSLEDLIETILRQTSIPRLRLSSLDPTEITDRLLGLMSQNAQLMPHFHVSLQNASSKVLRAMKRGYRQEDVSECLKKIHAANPDIYVGMDYIAGFPGETDQDHAESLALLKALPWTRLHVFPYSERAGTPATRIKETVPLEVRQRRAAELVSLSTQRMKYYAQQFEGLDLDGVLFESPIIDSGEVFATGHTKNYLRVRAKLDSEAAAKLRGTVGCLRIESIIQKPLHEWTLLGTVCPAINI